MKLMWGPLRLLRSKISYWWLITLPRKWEAAPVVDVAKVLSSHSFFLGEKVWKEREAASVIEVAKVLTVYFSE